MVLPFLAKIAKLYVDSLLTQDLLLSSVAGLFRLGPLLLLTAGTVLTSEPSVRCVSGVCVGGGHPGSVYRPLVCDISTVPALSR